VLQEHWDSSRTSRCRAFGHCPRNLSGHWSWQCRVVRTDISAFFGRSIASGNSIDYRSTRPRHEDRDRSYGF